MRCGIITVAPPGFCNMGEVRYGVYRGSRVRSPPVPVVLSVYQFDVALCSTALQCICHVTRRSSMTMKAHTYYIILDVHP